MPFNLNTFNEDWVTGKAPINDDVVQWTNDFAKYLVQNEFDIHPRVSGLTTSQIRKFFGEVKRIQSGYDKYGKDIPLLTAKLAYAVGRNRNSKIRDFYHVVSRGIHKVDDKKENFERLVSILESIVAFHKFHGGRD